MSLIERLLGGENVDKVHEAGIIEFDGMIGCTLVGINALYNPEWKCEIEAEAVIGSLQ